MTFEQPFNKKLLKLSLFTMLKIIQMTSGHPARTEFTADGHGAFGDD